MKRLVIALALIFALISDNATAIEFKKVEALGPGNRIHGMDISRWQHPYGATIDFKKMYDAGVRFVLIKGSDTIDSSDTLARKYLAADRSAAQAAGIFTGFYHFATLPDTSKTAILIEDAKAQAQKVVWRLASLGGYTNQDLPVALDIENNCVRGTLANCKRYTSKKFVTLWTQTFLDEVASKTNRLPFVYSYPQFLENAMARSKSLAKYPLWIATYGKDPAVPTNQPGLKKIGCYAHAWSKANCTPDWQIWQYTSCGIGSKYGVPSSRVDLNVFSGDENQFAQFTLGTWQPTPKDMLPINETSTIQIVQQNIGNTLIPSNFVVDVSRPDGTPVVTGTIDFKSADTTMSNGIQDVVRSSSGRWTLTINNLQAGSYVGYIEFIDETGTHAPSTVPIAFNVAQAATPSPSPITKPTPTRKPAPTPVDTCKNQIRN